MLFTVYIYTAQHYIAIRDTRKVYLLTGTGWIVLRCTCRPTSLAEKSHADRLLFFLSLPYFFFQTLYSFCYFRIRTSNYDCLTSCLLPQKLTLQLWLINGYWAMWYLSDVFYINICFWISFKIHAKWCDII